MKRVNSLKEDYTFVIHFAKKNTTKKTVITCNNLEVAVCSMETTV